jgi:hypothetical protein
VIVCPPYALTHACVKTMQVNFTVHTAETIKNFKLPAQTTSEKHPLLLL